MFERKRDPERQWFKRHCQAKSFPNGMDVYLHTAGTHIIGEGFRCSAVELKGYRYGHT